ncbi:MAG: agmatine deiminase family protein [Thermoplasmatota archaeon]|jgi:agmatine/peptidylarginine deiminase
MRKKTIIYLFTVIFLLILVNVTFAETNKVKLSENNIYWNDPNSLPIWLTEEEKLKIDEIGKNFQPTSPPPLPVRQPAEFEPMEGVLIRYPFGISYQIIAEMAEDVNVVTIVANNNEKNYVLTQYQNYGVNLDHCSFLIAPTDSYWTRDYGPWFIFNGDDEQGIVDFIYNRPRPNDDQIPTVYGNNQGIPVYAMNLVHSGGNYMTDGQGIAISTDLVWSENPGLTHDQINQIMHDYLGINTYHVVPDVNGQYIKHVDCWGKYLSPDIILIRQVPPSHPQYDEIEAAVDYFESQKSCYNTNYKVVRVYTPGDEPYTNSLILNNKVLVPVTGSQWDDEAIASYQEALPGYEVIGFTGSWQSTDALHCRVMGITDRYMLYIEHVPLYGNITSDNGVEIQAKIFPYSGEDIISSNTCVYWKVEGEDWNCIQLQPLGNYVYHAIIPPLENGTKVYYYIHAEDESGRKENHPYIGAPMAHSFTMINLNNPPDKPEKPSGVSEGKPQIEYTFNTSTLDPDSDQVYYKWSWGDGNFSDWLGPYTSGEIVNAGHIWSQKGTYYIKVKAKDIFGAESEWSDPMSITIPKFKNHIYVSNVRLYKMMHFLFMIFNKLLT